MLAEIDPEVPGKIRLAALYKHHELVKTVPGSSYKDRTWRVPLSWVSALSLRSVFGDELEVGPDLHDWVKREYEERIVPSYELRQALEADGLDSLYPYQRAGVKFLATARRALLADEMGTGKTRQSIAALMRIYAESGYNPFPALVVCPNSTKISWRREAEVIWPGVKATVVSGSATQRRKLLEEPAHLYIMNWESLRGHSRLAPYGSIGLKKCVEHGGTDESVTPAKCEVHPRELNEINFGAVIADEAHRAKDPQSKQTRALWAATGDADVRFALSGTPIASAPDDLWSILHWLSPAEWPSKTKFIDRFCLITYNGFGAATVSGIKPQLQSEFFQGVDPRLRRMPKDLVLRFLPPVISERRDVEMSPKQKKAYNEMRDQMVAELEGGDVLVTTSPLTQVTRLLQFASSYAELETYWDEKEQKNKARAKLIRPSNKIDAFLTDLPDFGDQSIVVFAVSRQLIELLSDELEKRKIPHGLITGKQSGDERQVHMDDFQAGRTKLILCTIAAGGTGITLTRGSVAVFLQRSWSMIENQQAEARVHRIGSEQHDSILMVDYVTPDTMEEVVAQAVARKSDRLEEILRDRELLRRVLETSRDGDSE